MARIPGIPVDTDLNVAGNSTEIIGKMIVWLRTIAGAFGSAAFLEVGTNDTDLTTNSRVNDIVVQSNFNETDTTSKAFIQNKPSNATDTVSGYVELATAAEVATGTNGSLVITPATLRGEVGPKATATDVTTPTSSAVKRMSPSQVKGIAKPTLLGTTDNITSATQLSGTHDSDDVVMITVREKAGDYNVASVMTRFGDLPTANSQFNLTLGGTGADNSVYFVRNGDKIDATKGTNINASNEVKVFKF